jgi:hypothetical protein
MNRADAIFAFLMVLGLGVMTWAGWVWYHMDQGGVATPVIETTPLPPIRNLEVPIRSASARKSTLKAAYAVQISEDEVKVYGGFQYVTSDKTIEGEEAIINVKKGSARNMKNVRIWENKDAGN